MLEPGLIALEAGLGVVTAASEAATLLTLPLLLTMPSAQVCSPERSNTTASSALLNYFSLKLYIQTEQTFATAGSAVVSRLRA